MKEYEGIKSLYKNISYHPEKDMKVAERFDMNKHVGMKMPCVFSGIFSMPLEDIRLLDDENVNARIANNYRLEVIRMVGAAKIDHYLILATIKYVPVDSKELAENPSLTGTSEIETLAYIDNKPFTFRKVRLNRD